jgi:hypothetical protein
MLHFGEFGVANEFLAWWVRLGIIALIKKKRESKTV